MMRQAFLKRPDLILSAKIYNHGNENLIHYDLVDQHGNEIINFPSSMVESPEHGEILQNMCLIMCLVNKTTVVNIGNEQFKVNWM